MRRVAIVGCAGSGKSILAVQLGQRLGVPVVHLDVLFWRPGWTRGEISSFRVRVAEALAGDAWVSDGNFINETFDLRLPRADALIILERPRWQCLVRVIWRAIFDRERPDLPEGCPERPDWELIAYIWNFDKVARPLIEAARVAHRRDVPVIRLRNDREVANFLASLGEVNAGERSRDSDPQQAASTDAQNKKRD